MDHRDAGKDYWVARMLGRDCWEGLSRCQEGSQGCQDAGKGHWDATGTLGGSTGMLEGNMGMPGKMPGWTKRLLKWTIRMQGGTTGKKLLGCQDSRMMGRSTGMLRYCWDAG